MNRNTLYEILEVSENASSEVIEKAYKVLAKKYHPDLQKESQKQISEKKMKEINEAYEILGNDEKRKEYDIKLKQERENVKYQQNINYEENNIRDNKNVSGNQENYDYEKERLKYEEKLRQEEKAQRRKMQEDLNKEYENAYYNYLRSLGFKIKHKWTKENIIDFIIVIGIMAIIFVALWFIPPTHEWMVNFYEQNPILKTIVDIVIGIVKGIFTGIWSFITGLFR